MSATDRDHRARTMSVAACPACCSRRGLAVGLAAGLSGCGEKPGSAGIVDGRRISVNEVQSADQEPAGRRPDQLRQGDRLPGALDPAGRARTPRRRPAPPARASRTTSSGRPCSPRPSRTAATCHVDLLNADALQALRGEVALSELDATGQAALAEADPARRHPGRPRYGTFDRTTGQHHGAGAELAPADAGQAHGDADRQPVGHRLRRAVSGGLTLLLTSPRVAGGLLSWPAWQALSPADLVLARDGSSRAGGGAR